MIVRIVRMEFEPEKVAEFVTLFRNSERKIRAFPGCLHLELWRDRQHPEVFFTYSHWQSEEALQQYRQSDFFDKTWNKTKKLFASKAQAWSLSRVMNDEIMAL